MKILALLAAILLPVSLVRADITIVQNVKQEADQTASTSI